MTSSYTDKITKLKNALENVFVKKTDVKNNLTSTDTDKPLSANQGKVLNTNKVDKVSGKGLSKNDFTDTYKTKLDNLDTNLDGKANSSHTHGNLQNDGSVGTSNNINKNVVTDGNGKITVEDKITIPTDVSQLSDNSNTQFTPKTHSHTTSDISDYLNSTEILQTDSLNDFSTQGFYYCSALKASQSELPSSVTGNSYALIVIDNYMHLENNEQRPIIDRTQIIISNNNYFTRKCTYTRPTPPNTNPTFYNASSWEKIPTLSSLSTVATSGSYNDLSNKPTIPKVFYGTCSSTASSQVKEVNTSSDYNLQIGTILFVKFQYGQSYNASADNPTQLKINDSTTNVDVAFNGESKGSRYHWYAGEVVCFVYDGTNFVMENEAVATTTYYGVTKLSSSTSSTSTSVAATPSAVKAAYDLASSHTHTSNNITDMETVTVTVTFTDNSTQDLILYKQTNNS